MSSFKFLRVVPLFAALAGPLANGQSSDTDAAPASAPVIQPKPDTTNPEPIDKRVFGVLPNYRTADGTLPYQPIPARRKLFIAAKDSFDWPSYITSGLF